MTKRFLICVFVLSVSLFGCSDETAFIKTAKAQVNSSSETSNRLSESKNESPVKSFGTYWKVKSDGEHAYGYSIELWKQDEKIYGLISAHRGFIGDPPAGLLENVQFNSKTRKFSFRAKLSLGWYGKDMPTHDIFEFEGILTNKKITGNLLIKNDYCPDTCIERKMIKLPRSKEWSKEMIEYQNYAEWKNYADKILAFRGPNW